MSDVILKIIQNNKIAKVQVFNKCIKFEQSSAQL